MSGPNYMTQESYDKLVAQIDQMKIVGRREASNAIAEAREKGDLSENAEYHAAKDAQGLLEMKISELDHNLMSARIIDASTLDTSKVTILANVKVKNMKIKKEVTYILVSKSEANFKEKKISVDSPIGQGLLGKKVGEIAEIETPGGILKLEVLEISI